MYKTMHKDNKRKKQNNCVVCFKSFYEEVSFKSVFSFNHCICDNCLQKFKSIDKITTICGIQTTFLYEYNDFFKSLLYQYKACYDIELKDVFLYKYKKIINKKYKNYVVIYPPSNKSENVKRGFIHIKEITSCLKLKSVDMFVKNKEYKQSDQKFMDRNQIQNIICLKNKIDKQKYLIVDDVYTSGNTLKTIIHLLNKNGIKNEDIKAIILSKKSDFVEL